MAGTNSPFLIFKRRFNFLLWLKDEIGMLALVSEMEIYIGDITAAEGVPNMVAITLIKALRWLGRDDDANRWQTHFMEAIRRHRVSQTPAKTFPVDPATQTAMELSQRFDKVVRSSDQDRMQELISDLERQCAEMDPNHPIRLYVDSILVECRYLHAFPAT